MSSQEEFAHLKLPLENIVEGTNNFAEENLIGQGGFGKVYKGNLLLSGKPTNIAARRLHYDYGQGDLEFWNEISMLASLKHENLVSFVGFCNEKGEKIIINEYEVNESLDKYLSSPTLTWMHRLQICVGVARALNYIHCGDGHESSVIHRNIKSSKILLDEKWKPKLSGFEHSKTNTKARRHRLVLADIIGTIGYVDPTYEKTGFVTHKSDVYSFGVVLFEVLCGRKASFQDQREKHSPQYVTEQDYKDGKLDVMEKVDPIPGPAVQKKERKRKRKRKDHGSTSTYRGKSKDGSGVGGEQRERGVPRRNIHRYHPKQSIVDSQPSSFVDGQPSSFVDGQPSSFVSGQSSSFGSGEPSLFYNQPTSFNDELPSREVLSFDLAGWYNNEWLAGELSYQSQYLESMLLDNERPSGSARYKRARLHN